MKKGQTKDTTRSRILKSTFDIISEEGFQNVTIRKIANLAKVNIALINYHFKSKDHLINESLKYMTGGFMDCFEKLDNLDAPVEARLKDFIKCYSDATVEYPDVFRNLVTQSISNPKISFEYIKSNNNEGFEKLKKVLQELNPKENNDTLSIKIFLMISSLAFPALLGEQMKGFAEFDYNDLETRNNYLEHVFKLLLS